LGNRTTDPDDYWGVNCESVRSSISALLDGEAPVVPVSDVEQHVQSCRSCRSWRGAAHEVTRRARLEAARSPARSTDDLLTVVLERARPPRRPSLLAWARSGLVAVASAQLAVTVPLLLGRDHGAPTHLAHEMGSFDMALAVGFLVAARRPERARGMQALVGAAAVFLVFTATLDLIAHRTSVGDEAPHVLAVVGWFLILYVAAVSPPERLRPPRFAPRLRFLPDRFIAGSERDDDFGSTPEGLRENRPVRIGDGAGAGDVWQVG
jgi:predicted anti-sigma-YlaC factor YlaD